MVSQRIIRRLAAAEHHLQSSKPTLQEVSIKGGLLSGMYPQASIDGETIAPEVDEDFADFQQRVRTIALDQRAKTIVYGGLPNAPNDWATPPAMDAALAKANRLQTDELDSDDLE